MFGEKIIPELQELFMQKLGKLIDKYMRIDQGEIKSVRSIVELFRWVDVINKKDQRLKNILEKTELLKDHSMGEKEL